MKFGLFVTLILLIAGPACAQNFGFQEPFHLVDLGNGAAAMGMGGAFVAIADDLSALYWNPAGLSSQRGLRLQFDSLYTTGSEKFAVTTYRSGTSQHDYSVDGFQPQSLAATYQFQHGDVTLGPSFGWNRASLFLHNCKMDTPASGHMTQNNLIIESDYTSLENVTFDRSGEDIYTFGFSIRKGDRLSFGGTWNVLGGEVNRTQSIHQTAEGMFLYPLPNQEPVVGPFSEVLNRTDLVQELYSGSYGNFGVLYKANRKISIGGSVRTGYKRKVTRHQTVLIDFDRSGLIPASDHRTAVLDPEIVEYSVPPEFSGGLAIALTPRARLGTSLTFADYTPDFAPGNNDFFPTLRDGYTYQSRLVQWRNGVDYRASDTWNLRAGWILDGQPYSKEYYPVNTPDDSPFNSFTLGAGWKFGKGAVDIAYLHETGSARFGNRIGGISDHDIEFSEGHLSHNRFFFSVLVQP